MAGLICRFSTAGAEGFDGTNGWTIGDEASYPNADAQDAADLESLYRRLEHDVIRPSTMRMGQAIPVNGYHDEVRFVRTPQFHSNRQVIDYVQHIYTAG